MKKWKKPLVIVIFLLVSTSVFAMECPKNVDFLTLPKSAKVLECTNEEEKQGKFLLRDTYWTIYSIPVKDGDSTCFIQKWEQRLIYSSWTGSLKDSRIETDISPILCDAQLE